MHMALTDEAAVQLYRALLQTAATSLTFEISRTLCLHTVEFLSSETITFEDVQSYKQPVFCHILWNDLYNAAVAKWRDHTSLQQQPEGEQAGEGGEEHTWHDLATVLFHFPQSSSTGAAMG